MFRAIVSVFASAMLMASAVYAENMFNNADFNAEGKGVKGVFYDFISGVAKVSIATEDKTWNKCLKIELTALPEGKQRDLAYINCWIGRDGGYGVKVEPDTVYEFQFEYKGNIAPSVNISEWKGKDLWKDKKNVKPIETTPLAVSEGEWKVAKGTFKTTATAKGAAILLSLRWTPAQVGKFVMIDNVKIEKKAALLPPAEQGSLEKVRPVDVPCLVPGEKGNGFVLGKKKAVHPRLTLNTASL
ncbi:MAG: hypothetical protein IKS20_08655 [Victivallales bacterium]|nr:hypothetical protein [Victivallales bacterium]